MAASMDERVKGLKLSKAERRTRKKQFRSQETMLRHLDSVSCSSDPTSNLLVANGGLGNGVEREQLWTVFQFFGAVLDVIMIPQKPFAFVCFTDTDNAVRVVTHLNGRSLSDALSIAMGDEAVSEDNKVILYLSYVHQVPSQEENSVCYEPPPGLAIHRECISELEEADLMSCIDWQQNSGSGNVLKHRRVRHYGYAFDYSINNVDRNKPLAEGLPTPCSALLQRLIDQRLIHDLPDQLTVNQYQPGQGIPPHTDTHSAFEDEIVIVNLQAEVVMEFRCTNEQVDLMRAVVLPRRSVVVMSGEARYRWTHGITPRKSDIVPANSGSVPLNSDCAERLTLLKRGTRTSLTFRKVRHTACCCAYPKQCDSQSGRNAQPVQQTFDVDEKFTNQSTFEELSDKIAAQLEIKHVLKVYDEIADHFSSTRHTPWPRVVEFLQSLPDGSIVADIGCGNGKYLGVNPKLFMIGGDTSQRFCEIVRDRGFEANVSDIMSIPLRENCCDAVICIAVIHHLASQARRLRALCNIARLLRPGGKALIYVWALEQKQNNVRSKYLKPSSTLSSALPKEVVTSSTELLSSHTNKGPCVKSCSCSSQTDNSCSCSSPDCNSTNTTFSLPVHQNRTEFEIQDIFVPWKLRGDGDAGKKQKSSKQNGCKIRTIKYSESMQTTNNVERENQSIEQGLTSVSSSTDGLRDVKPAIEDRSDNCEHIDSEIVENSANSSYKSKKIETTGNSGVKPDIVDLKNAEGSNKPAASYMDEGSSSTYHRYYHVFREGELQQLCSLIEPPVDVVNSYYDEGNWCGVFQKRHLS